VIYVLGLGLELSSNDERLIALEQATASLRSDFLQAIIENTRSMSTLNKVIIQQEQNTRDSNHEITILTGMISAQGRDIKDIKSRLDSFDQRFTSLENRFTSLEQHFTSLERRLTSLEDRFTSLEQQVTSLDGKIEQVLRILTTQSKTNN